MSTTNNKKTQQEVLAELEKAKGEILDTISGEQKIKAIELNEDTPEHIKTRANMLIWGAMAQADRMVKEYEKRQAVSAMWKARYAEIKESASKELSEAAKAKRERKRLIRMGMPLPKPERKPKDIPAAEPEEKKVPNVGKNERKQAMLEYDKQKQYERAQRKIEKRKAKAAKKVVDNLTALRQREVEIARFKIAQDIRDVKKSEKNAKYNRKKLAKTVIIRKDEDFSAAA